MMAPDAETRQLHRPEHAPQPVLTRHLVQQLLERFRRKELAWHGRNLYREAFEYTRTRAAGSPVASRSPMTATQAAPARMTSAAASSVIPPIATRGRPFGATAAAASATQSHADRIVAGRLRRGPEHRPDRDVASPALAAPRRLAPACASTVRRSPPSPPRPERRSASRSSCPTCTPSAPLRRATSARSLTMTRRRRRAPARTMAVASASSRPLGASLARSCRSLAPPGQVGGGEIVQRSQPARSATSASTIAISGGSGVIQTASARRPPDWAREQAFHERRAQLAGDEIGIA